ncbi:MAG: glutaredoxin family protein [Actinobacteria bacterium]|nr:glutaredoxin family protein [Actinomycetota bacterium]
MNRVTLFAKPGCTLCDQAKAVLDREGIAFHEVDINSDRGLKEEYGWFIPVVEVQGRWVFEAGMDPEELPGLISAET